MQAYLFVLEYSTSYNKTQCQLSKRLAGPIIAHSLWCDILLLVWFGRGFYLLMWFLAALADLYKQGRQDVQDRRDAEHWTMLSLWDHRDIRMISWQVRHVLSFDRFESLLNISKEKSRVTEWTPAVVDLLLRVAGATRVATGQGRGRIFHNSSSVDAQSCSMMHRKGAPEVVDLRPPHHQPLCRSHHLLGQDANAW